MASEPWTSGTAHTLAQFARRARISEGRARALYAERPSGLPHPDRTDAGGRPLWWGSTIDAWCASTGRPVSESALWIFRGDAAAAPPVELARGRVELAPSHGRPRMFFHILWDTPQGHVIYLLPLDTGGDHPDWIAHVAAELIEPRWWSTALVLMPFAETFPFDEPIAYVYRLIERTDQPDVHATGQPGPRAARTGQGAPLAGLRSWFSRLADSTRGEHVGEGLGVGSRPASVTAEWITHLDLEEIARPLGVRLPVWLEGTLNDATITRSLAYDRSFTVPDTTTGWSDVAARVQQALDAGVPEKFPAGWAVLAVDAMQRLTAIRAAHEQVADSGPGWYLVARPARPQVPIALEDRLAAAEPCPDMTTVVAELGALRQLEADADRDDPLGDLYAELIQLLHYQLRHHLSDCTRPTGRVTSKNSTGERPDSALVAAYEDTIVRYSSAWSGAAIDVWASTLQLVDDPAAALRLRRVQRLLDPSAGNPDPADVRIYRDPAGRYVVVHPPRQDQPWFAAEWPTSRAAVAGWTDKTMLVAEHNANTTTLLALTPTPDGQMRADPVPMPVNPAREAFAFGYGGGTPATTHLAILRCALDPVDFDALAGGKLWRTIPNPATGDEEPVSQLGTEISTSRGGPLRLSWPQVQRWAHDTVRTVRNYPTNTS